MIKRAGEQATADARELARGLMAACALTRPYNLVGNKNEM